MTFSRPLLASIALMCPLFSADADRAPTTLPNVAIPVPYTAPKDGFISLAVCNEQGQLVRSLLYAQKVKAGKGVITWDGTSDLGVPQVAGRYASKAIFFAEKPKADYVMTVGKSGNPPYRTPDGKGDWGGNLGGPAAVCANSTSVMQVWGCVEDNQITGIQQTDAAGNIIMRYYSFYPWDTRLAGAMDETHFYLGIMNAGKKQVEIAAYELGQPRGRILTVLPTKPHEDQTETRWRGRFTASIDGMALTADTIFATITADDALFIIDRTSGKIRKQVTISSPRDVKVAAGGLLIQSGNTILRLTLEGEVERTVVAAGVLDNPRALTVAADGSFYSSGAQGQIAHFDAQGKLRTKIGKTGGAAPTGRYVSEAFGDIASMSLGPNDDSLWIQDVATGFPRTTRWSLTGKLMKEWFTPKLALWSHTLNIAHPNELIETASAFADTPSIRAYEVDWDKKTWRPGWFYNNTWDEIFACTDVYHGYGHGGNPLNGPRGGTSPWPIFHFSGRTFVTHAGKDFFMNENGNDDGAIFHYSSEHKPKPVALVGFHHVSKNDDGTFEGSYDQGPNQWMTWADRNLDGKMSADEIIHVKDVPALADCIRVAESRLDADLNVHLQMLRRDSTTRFDYVLPPKEILPGGIPVYDWSMVQKTPAGQPNFAGGDGSKEVHHINMTMPLQADDGLYAIASPESSTKLNLPGIDGDGWWASRNWRNKLVKFDNTTGQVLWAVGRRAPGIAQPGQMYCPKAVSGKVGDAIFVADALSVVWAWNSDGLYLGRLFRDSHAGTSDVPVSEELYGEIQSTCVFTHPQTGKFYHIGTGTETRIHELTLPTIQHLPSTAITLSPDLAKAARPWDPDGLAPTEKPTFIAKRKPVSGDGSTPVNIDGEADGREGWGKPMLILLDGGKLASTQIMYDDSNLYLAYSVRHAAGAANSGSELPYAPFVSGAYVDFAIARDWAQPQRREVLEGDLRVIIARVNNGGSGTESIFNQGFWQKRANGTNPQTISSPAASVHFDQITTVPGLQAAYRVAAKDERSNTIPYTVEISVPLASLGLKDVAGKSIGFDASVGIANDTGDQRVRAAHWAGLSEGHVVDRPGSAVLLPHTWGTLTFAATTQPK